MSNKLFELLIDDSFVRFLKGDASEKEEARWSAWLQEKTEHREFVNRGRRLLAEGLQTISGPNAESELQLLIERIESAKRPAHLHAYQKKRDNLIWITLAAAAGILLLVGFLSRDIFFQDENSGVSKQAAVAYQTMTTEYGERKTVRYSDGSKIILNSGSELRLPKNVSGDHSMEVWLKGEALFNINRKTDPEPRNFIVHTPDSDIGVLGTQFAVNTNGGKTRVVLETGRLYFNARDSLNNRDLEYEMVPGELALFSSTYHEIQVQKVNPDVYLSWAGDSLILDQTPFSDLIDRIEFTYGVKVAVEDKELHEEKLTGKFGNLDLEFLLKGLAKTLDVSIERKDNTIYIKNNEPTGS